MSNQPFYLIISAHNGERVIFEQPYEPATDAAWAQLVDVIWDGAEDPAMVLKITPPDKFSRHGYCTDESNSLAAALADRSFAKRTEPRPYLASWIGDSYGCFHECDTPAGYRASHAEDCAKERAGGVV